MELDGVRLKLFHKDDTEYDLIETDKAEFDPATKNLYSDDKVDITMGVAAEGAQRGRLLKIHTSGVHFEKDSGRATTDRAAHSNSIKAPAPPSAPSTIPTPASFTSTARRCSIGPARRPTPSPCTSKRPRPIYLRARIQGGPAAMVQALARGPENGRRQV